MVLANTTVGHTGERVASLPKFVQLVTTLWDNSYLTGGELFDPEAVLSLDAGDLGHVSFGAGWQGFTPEYDRTNKKILLFFGGAVVSLPQAQVTNAFDVSAIVAGEVFIHHD